VIKVGSRSAWLRPDANEIGPVAESPEAFLLRSSPGYSLQPLRGRREEQERDRGEIDGDFFILAEEY
jgi:hypothetical protein